MASSSSGTIPATVMAVGIEQTTTVMKMRTVHFTRLGNTPCGKIGNLEYFNPLLSSTKLFEEDVTVDESRRNSHESHVYKVAIE